MSRRIGYVVVEFNQASGQPEIPTFSDLHLHQDDAQEERERLEAGLLATGRRETYEIAELVLPEEDDD